MVSPRTHLEKNHDYQSRTVESQFKDPETHNYYEFLGLYVTTELSEDRLQNSVYSFYCQHNKIKRNMCC